MAQPIAPDYGQQFLLPPALEDWVGKDHPVRYIREFVDQQDLAALGFVIPAAAEGRPPYAPGLLLKIWLYGYYQRIRSTRKLEAACRDQLPLIWLAGMHQPDHNSLWRFWRDNRKALRELFGRSVKVAMEAELVGLVLQAVDGTKIQALASTHGGWSKRNMEKVLAALTAELDDLEKALEQEGDSSLPPGFKLPKQLEDRQALRQKIQQGLHQLESDKRRHYHPKEPEARRMNSHGKQPYAYNAQAMVDQKHGIVVAAALTREEEDSNQLVGMVQLAEQNTGKAVLTVADGNYGTGAQIALAQQKHYDVLVHPKEGGKIKGNGHSARDFHYVQETGQLVCPQSQPMKYRGEFPQKGQTVKKYSCQIKHCPVAHLCKDRKGRRVIEIWPHTPAVQAMKSRLKDPVQYQKLRLRGRIIERHFGHIKQHDGFRRWTVRGVENVSTQWAMLNLVSNLRVLYKHWKN